MVEQETRPKQLIASGVIATGKDCVSLLRDITIFLLAVLLIVFPKTFNAILVDAGFDKGNFMGMEWKSGLAASNSALEDAQQGLAALEAKNAELLKQLGAAATAAPTAALTEQVARMQSDTAQLKEQTQHVQTKVTQAIASNAPLIAQLSPVDFPANKTADFLVGLQTSGMPDDDRKALNEKIRALGYRLHELSASYEKPPAWFAQRSTVLYYAPSASAAAQELARALKDVTGHEFAVQRGSGRGVDPSQQAITLFVHYIKS